MTAWAAENGYRLLRWFIDDAISGTTTRGRNAFEQLIAKAENGRDFDAILCYDISRFSRGGTNETGYYLHRMRLVGVDVLFTADGIPEGDEGELIQGVKSWQARQYSVKLARDSIRGQISNIRERKSAPGGMPPFGYDKQHLSSDGKVLRVFRWLQDGRKQEFDANGKLVRVLATGEMVKKAKSDIVRFVPSLPERVATIKRIFKMCVDGYGYNYIASRLNDDGVEGPFTTPWHSCQVARTLANPTYRGALAWNKKTMGKINSVAGDGTLHPKRERGSKRNALADWIVVENVHEPIVSAATFAKAREGIAGRCLPGSLALTPNRALLAGLIVCKHCGRNFLQKKVKSPCHGGLETYRRIRGRRKALSTMRATPHRLSAFSSCFNCLRSGFVKCPPVASA